MDGIHVATVDRIGQDPERRFTSSETEVLHFSVLPADSTADDPPKWVRCSVFADKLDEHRADKLTNCVAVYIEGGLRLGRLAGQDGAPRSGLNVSQQARRRLRAPERIS